MLGPTLIRTGRPGALLAACALMVAILGAVYAAVYRYWELLDHLFLSLPGSDKVLHFGAGAAAWTIVFWGMGLVFARLPRGRRALLAFGIALAVAIGDELSQSFASGRTVDWRDPLASLAGVVFAFACAGLLRARRAAAAVLLSAAVLAWTVTGTYTENHLFFEGMLLQREGRNEEAYARYRLALTEGEPSVGLYNNIAWLCLEELERDYELALQWAKIGAALDPDNPDMLDTLGWAYYKNGDLQRAWENIAAAARLAPGNRIIHEHVETLRAEMASVGTEVRHVVD